MATSELISAGARREEIINRLYRSHKISDLKLWGKVLNNLKLENPGDLAWSWLSKEDADDLRGGGEALRDMVDELMSNLPDTKIFMILIEKDLNLSEVFVFSLKNINVLDVFKEYSPIGTIKNAFFNVEQNIKTVISEKIAETNKKLDKLK
jgi:nanoRNase/pAp phosphatase (c-di-AMP/oligoRNAs hydrolase)